MKQFDLLCDSAEKEQSDSLGSYAGIWKNDNSILFGISKNNQEASHLNININLINGSNKGKEFDCFLGVNEFIVNKSKEDKNSLNFNAFSVENKESSSSSKISKISKIINENLCENSFNINSNDNYNYGNRNNFNNNLIQLGNLKNNDNNNFNKISPTKNQVSNLKNSCKIYSILIKSLY